MNLSLVATIAPHALVSPRILFLHNTLNGTVAVQDKICAYRPTFTTNQLRWLVLNTPLSGRTGNSGRMIPGSLLSVHTTI
jgi:hypothetical protein